MIVLLDQLLVVLMEKPEYYLVPGSNGVVQWSPGLHAVAAVLVGHQCAD